jgi:uncharacterized glyoxalase superfamily protein PhnB
MAARRKAKAKKSAPKQKAAKKAASKKSSARAKKAAPAAKPIRAMRKSPETLRLRLVTPALTVGDLQKSIAWYRDVLGFVVGETWKQDGQVRGCELLAGAARLYLGQDDWAKGRDRKKGEGLRLHCATVQDVDQIAAHVKKAGGKLDAEPMTMSWGARQFAITDPDGFKLSISSQ